MIERRAEDRWSGAPVRKASLAMSGVVIASLAIHAGLLLVAGTFADHALPAPPKETIVELVREPATSPDMVKETPAPPEAEASKPPQPEPPKPEEAKAEQAKSEQAKADDAKADDAKADEPKPVPASQPMAEPAKPEAPKAAEARPAEPAEDAKIAEKEAALQSLKQELEGLKAEQEALKAETEAAAAAEARVVDNTTFANGAKDIGAIPSMFGAMQLPQLSETTGEVTGYEQIVFSRLARTKGVRRHMAMMGTAGIVFTIDASGGLVKAMITRPSGSAELDEEAMQIVNASAPFPKPPPGAKRTISANFNYVPQPEP